MIEPPRILQTAAQTVACIHITVPRSEIRKVMGPGLAELKQELRSQGIVPTGPWLTHHLRMDPAIFDYELCLPVAGPVKAAGRVKTSELPATTAAYTLYSGPYEELASGWSEFEAWIAARGHRSAPSLWETYLVDPSVTPDPAAWRTGLTRPLLD